MESGLVDYLGVVGKSLSSEVASAIKIGLAALSRTHQAPVKYWGSIEGINADYQLAQTEFADGVFAAAAAAAGSAPAATAQVTFFSADGGVRWRALPTDITPEQYEYCEQLRGPYTGDADYEYKVERPLPEEAPAPMEEPAVDDDGVPIGGDGDADGDADGADGDDGADGADDVDGGDAGGGDDDDAAPKKKRRKFRVLVMKEIVRLSHFVAVRDAQCRLVPRGAFVTRDDGATASPNPAFAGLTVENAQRLAHYLHAGAPAASLAGDARRRVIANNKSLFGALHHASFDFLPSAAEDMPQGTWSVKYNATLDVAVLHNLLFKGSYFFHKPGTNRYWSVYAGNGQRLLDLAFVLP
jgi:hypothetical protein